MLCDQICACAITSSLGTVSITGSGTPADPWVIDTANASDITQLIIDVANLQAADEALPGTYVNVTGDLMTGELAISKSSGPHLRLIDPAAGVPFLDFRDSANTRCGFLQGRTTTDTTPGTRLAADSGDPVRLYANGGDRLIVDGSSCLIYKTAAGIANQGFEALSTGSLLQTRGDVNSTLNLNKVSTGASASGSAFASFQLAGSQIGSITRNAATSAVLYNTTSDADLKTVIDDLDPELAEYVLALLTPVMFTWNDDETDTPIVGYIAQQVAKAWPQSVELGLVTPGYGDVSDRTWDTDGNETTPEGVWASWMMDKSVLIPLLHASLVRTTTKLSYLRAEFDEFKASVEDRLAALEDA